MIIQKGASISVAAIEGSAGQAGNLDINASKSVEVSGIGSTLLAESENFQQAGNLTISTDKFVFQDGAEVNVSSQGTGNAGNLEVTAGSIRRDNKGKFKATSTSAEGGNIKLSALDLLLSRGNSEISTEAVSGLVAQGCDAGGSSLARGGSQFVVTGRDGLPPTPAEANRNDTTLADLGTPGQIVDNRASDANFETGFSPTTLVEAQGWVLGSKGEVILTTSATIIPDVPWLKPTSCNAS